MRSASIRALLVAVANPTGPCLLRRSWAGGLVVLAVVLAATPVAGAGADDRVGRGRELYVEGCVSCHGIGGRGVSAADAARGAGGVRGEGPSLLGVGAASAHFYLSTGAMPLRDPDEQPDRRDPAYDEAEIDALVAYVASLPRGGPAIPEVRPERGDLAQGFAAYTEFCAGCHQSAVRGGVVVGGTAPPLDRSTATQIGEAIRIGPYLMPRFGEDRIDAATVDSIARYVLYARDPPDEGGFGLGHVGPIPEGLVAWLAAGVVLVAVCRVIGKRAG